MEKEQTQNAIRHLLDLIEEAGSQGAIGRIVGKRQQSVSTWCNGIPIPAECVVRLHQELGADLHTLRPDVFPEKTQLVKLHERTMGEPDHYSENRGHTETLQERHIEP